MREQSKRAIAFATRSILNLARVTAKSLVEPGVGDVNELGLAWRLLMNAALSVEQDLEQTEEGRQLLEQSRAGARAARGGSN